MKASNSVSGMLVIGLLAALAGCNSALSDWNKAAEENTVAAYQRFATAHPGDPHAPEAQTRLISLQDDQAWAAASATGVADDYQRYLQQWPAGKHDEQARAALAAVSESAAWRVAQADGSSAAMQGYLQKYPNGSQAAAAKAKIAELSGFRAQFGSEPTQVRAQQKLAQLKRRFSATMPELFVISPVSQDGKYAIASAGMTQSHAQETCDSLKPTHQSCKVVSSVNTG